MTFWQSLFCTYVGVFLNGFIQLHAQQVIDSTFTYEVIQPAYNYNQGPLIAIDEYHNNDMSVGNRMFPLINVLKNDGYRIEAWNKPLTQELNGVNTLVIIGALHYSNVNNWKLPTPEAMSDEEIDQLLNWIQNGGNLLLVADHMPFPGAVKKLSTKLGVEWYNGFVIDSINWGLSIFSRREKTLKAHPLLEGRNIDEKINWVATYYGSGFQLKDNTIKGLFSFNNPDVISYQTTEAWRMFPDTPTIPSNLLFQAAVFKKGKGRVAIIGEASLFSAQLVGKDKQPVGINFNNQNQNLQFVLNLFHWLSGAID